MLHLRYVHPNHNFHVKNCKFTNLKIAHQSQEVSVKEHVRDVLRITFEIHNTPITHNTFSL